MPGGVTAEGLQIPTIEEILAEIETEALAEIDPALDLSPDQPVGQIFGIVARRFAVAYEALAVAYNGFNPSAAEGVLLENVAAISGTTRTPARRSTVVATVNLGASFSAPAGTMIANVNGQPNTKFRNASEVTSTSAGNYQALFESEEVGPVVANAGTLTVITASVSGWNSITNADDAERGSVLESDTDLRVRRQDELAAPGASTPDAIRADLLQLDGVREVFVFENTSDVWVDGLGPKKLEIVVYDGTNLDADEDEIARAIWDAKPAGIGTSGLIAKTVTSDDGSDVTVRFSRAVIKPVWFDYTLTIDPKAWPSNGADLVKAAAVAKGSAVLGLGVDVVALVFRAAALTVPGVVDVTDFDLGFSASPSGEANLTVSRREIAVVDTSRVTVVTT